MVFGLGAAALVAALATLVVRSQGLLARTQRRQRGARTRWKPHEIEGGLIMSNGRRRFWGRGESRDSDVSEEPIAEAAYASPPERIADYAAAEEAAPDRSGHTADAEEGPRSHFAKVGAEIESVLASAREAADRIRASAESDAAQLREGAVAAANAEVADAKRAAAEDRSEAERVRSDAEEYAEETRSSAETAAEEVRAEAEREAAEIVEAAQARLAEADVEADRRLREIEGSARDRVAELRAAIERHEARLESMLAVFQGVSAQLEELLGARGDADDDAAEQGLENALRLNIVHSNDD